MDNNAKSKILCWGCTLTSLCHLTQNITASEIVILVLLPFATMHSVQLQLPFCYLQAKIRYTSNLFHTGQSNDTVLYSNTSCSRIYNLHCLPIQVNCNAKTKLSIEMCSISVHATGILQTIRACHITHLR